MLKCYLADHGFEVFSGGPCCWIKFPNVTSHTELHNLPEFQELRDTLYRGKWPSKCESCKNIEINQSHDVDATQWSLRQAMANQYEKSKGDKQRLKHLVLNTGRLCNLQCRSCNQSLSSSWDKEFLEWRKKPAGYDITQILVENEYDYTKDDLSGIRHLSLRGGEPLYMPKFMPLVKKILEETKGNCLLQITTNATIPLNIKRYPWILDFKEILIVLSIDAIEKPAEFIRTNCQWHKVENVLQEYVDFANKYKNVRVHYHTTHSILNLFYLDDTTKRMQEIGLTPDIGLIVVSWPRYLTFDVLTDVERSEAIDILTSQNRLDVAQHLSTSRHNPDLRAEFLRFMSHTKKFHNMDWADYLPRLYQFMTTNGATS